MQSSCSSAIPDKISEAFKTVNSLIMFDLGIKGLDQVKHDGFCMSIKSIQYMGSESWSTSSFSLTYFHTRTCLLLLLTCFISLDQCTRIEVQCVRISNIFLSNEIAKTWMWPARLPPLTVCKTVRQELKHEVLDDQFEPMQNKVKEWKGEEDKKQAKKEAAANEAAKKEAAAKEAAKKEAAARKEAAKEEAAKKEAAKKEAAKKEAAKKEAAKKEALAMV